MGPGYFPFWLGIVLALLGLVLCAGATSAKTPRLPLQRWDWRTLAWMTGSVAAFGLALKPLGLVLSVFGLVVASSLASREFTWRGTLLNAAVLVLLNTVLFVLLLDLPLPLWPA
ncbi:MAG: tripartite tricarboxylate transporter TctB family protein, partial [Comamonas sp.]